MGFEGMSITPGDDAKGQIVDAVEKAIPGTDDFSIENEPLSPVVEKYKVKIDQLFAKAGEVKSQAEKLKRNAQEIDINDNSRTREREDMLRQSLELGTQAHQLYSRIFTGGEDLRDMIIEFPPQVRREGEKERGVRNDAAIEEYRNAMDDSPQMILRLARESGDLGVFSHIDNIPPRLLRDEKFIEALAQTDAAKNNVEFQVAQRDGLFRRYADNARGRKKIDVEREIEKIRQAREEEKMEAARVSNARVTEGTMENDRARRASEEASAEARRTQAQRAREEDRRRRGGA